MESPELGFSELQSQGWKEGASGIACSCSSRSSETRRRWQGFCPSLSCPPRELGLGRALPQSLPAFLLTLSPGSSLLLPTSLPPGTVPTHPTLSLSCLKLSILSPFFALLPDSVTDQLPSLSRLGHLAPAQAHSPPPAGEPSQDKPDIQLRA